MAAKCAVPAPAPPPHPFLRPGLLCHSVPVRMASFRGFIASARHRQVVPWRRVTAQSRRRHITAQLWRPPLPSTLNPPPPPIPRPRPLRPVATSPQLGPTVLETALYCSCYLEKHSLPPRPLSESHKRYTQLTRLKSQISSPIVESNYLTPLTDSPSSVPHRLSDPLGRRKPRVHDPGHPQLGRREVHIPPQLPRAPGGAALQTGPGPAQDRRLRDGALDDRRRLSAGDPL